MNNFINLNRDDVLQQLQNRLRNQIPPTPPSSPSGIKLLHDPPTPAVADVVFVHGLTGHRENTWTSPAATDPWPKSLLPASISNVRVLAFGYDGSVTDSRGVVINIRVGNHAQGLMNALATFRQEDGSNERPIIFVCHSLGGLVCEDALKSSSQRPEKHLQAIYQSTKGIVFLGTPHHSSGLAVWAERLYRSIGMMVLPDFCKTHVLRQDSEVLSQIQDGFHTMIQSRNRNSERPVEIACFYEELPTPTVGLIVPREFSILPGYKPMGIRGNHQDMSKFSSPEEVGFVAICAEIRRWVKEIHHTAVADPLRPGSEGTEAHRLSATEVKRRAGYFVVPHSRNAHFVGRIDILEQLKQGFAASSFSGTNGQRRICLGGLSGIGKTQIALEYVHWLHGIRPSVSIFWVDASTRESLQQSYAEIALMCGIPGRRNPSVDVLSLVKTWLQKEEHGTWFLVVDNADNPDLFSLHFLPDCCHGSILVTTRHEESGLKLVPGKPPIEVEKMNDDESTQMIRTMMRDPEVADDKIHLLSSRLHHLPLALAQASAFMLEKSITIDHYLGSLDKSDDAVVNLLRQPSEAVGQDANVPHSVMLAWVVSFEEVGKQNELAGMLLSIMAFFDHQAIPKDLLMECWAGAGVLSKSKSLSSSSGLKRSRSASPYAPCPEETSAAAAGEGPTEAMRAYMWRKMNTPTVRINPSYPDFCHIEQYSYDMLDLGGREWKELTPRFAADCSDDLDQYARCKEDEIPPAPRKWTMPMSLLMPVSPPPIRMLPFDADLEARFTRIRSTGPSLWDDSTSSIFFSELEKALGVLESFSLISENSDGSVAMQGLVKLAARKWLSKDSSGSSFEREALHAMVRAFPVAVYDNLDQCKKMLPHALAVLGSKLAEAGQDVLLRSILYENVARVYIIDGQTGVVPQLLEQPLTRATTELGEQDPLVFQMMRIMAVALCDQGRSKESKPWLSRLMAFEKKYHEKSHPQLLRAMSALAVHFHIEGKYRQAESILVEALENIDKEQLNHVLMAMRVELTVQLVGILISSRRFEEALGRSSEALTVLQWKRCYQLDHPVALRIFAAQAIIYREQGDFEKQVLVCRKALEGRDIVSDPAQPYLLPIMEELGKGLTGLHRFDEAQQIHEKVLDVRAQTCCQSVGLGVKGGIRQTESEELPMYTLDASVRSFDSLLLQKFEDHASITSRTAHNRRDILTRGYYPASKSVRI